MRLPFILSVSVVLIVVFASCSKKNNQNLQVQQWHTLTLSFKGPNTSETDDVNPFINYVLLVEFTHGRSKKHIRGFYAADGNAAETSADSGAIWQVRFTPHELGEWNYSATLFHADSVAFDTNFSKAERMSISNGNGKFEVVPSDKRGDDFRSRGRIIAQNSYFKFQGSENYFLKVGADSPENFLAYTDFDNTYRMDVKNRDGEAQTNASIHSYKPHLKDWVDGDPVWQNDKGRAIVGAVNYLASKGMNVVYFLTLNIGGDGKDVWMYTDPNDFTRFDVSKLEQWEFVFQHLQAKGIMLHVVLQETENETLLDNGNMGPTRKLYYQELIARFGHHLALVWNLGEENGPAPWTPDKPAQNDEQRKAGAKFLKEKDPYNHPVVLHTLPDEDMREGILSDLLGYEYLDGISLQHADRETVAQVIANWKERSVQAQQPWLIAMDEIGMWHTGAKADTADPNHPTLTRYVLWGSLLSGAAGVEWYFGAYSAHNDLSSEDWRQRNQLWEITNHAKSFFERYLPYWEMEAQHTLLNVEDGYCFAKDNAVYALYVPEYSACALDLTAASGRFSIDWYEPLKGGNLQSGSVKEIKAGEIQDLGLPPHSLNNDWVILIRAIE